MRNSSSTLVDDDIYKLTQTYKSLFLCSVGILSGQVSLGRNFPIDRLELMVDDCRQTQLCLYATMTEQINK